MNNLTATELTEIIATIQDSLHPHSLVKWDYWFRTETYEMLDEWEIDRETIQQLVYNLTSDDVIKSELQHGNRRGLVLVFAPWLYPSLGQQTFAYLKLALTFDKTNRLHTVSVLSFKAANRDYDFDFPQTSGCFNYYEYNYFTWLTSQPKLVLGIPEAELTPCLIETVITTSPETIGLLPLEVLTQEYVERACTINPLLILDVPETFWTLNLLRAAVRCEPRAILDIPERYHDVFMALDACRKAPELIYEIASTCLQPTLLQAVAAIDPYVVSQLDNRYLDDELVKQLLKMDATILYTLEHTHWNEARLQAAVMKDPFGLQFACETDLTPIIMSVAIATDANALAVVPKTVILTLKQLLAAVETYPQAVQYYHDWTPATVKMVLALNAETLKSLPTKVIDGQTAYELAWEQPHLFPFVPQSYLNQALVDHVLAVEPQLLAIVPKQFKQTAMCAKLVATDPSLWQYVPKHIKARLQQLTAMSA